MWVWALNVHFTMKNHVFVVVFAVVSAFQAALPSEAFADGDICIWLMGYVLGKHSANLSTADMQVIQQAQENLQSDWVFIDPNSNPSAFGTEVHFLVSTNQGIKTITREIIRKTIATPGNQGSFVIENPLSLRNEMEIPVSRIIGMFRNRLSREHGESNISDLRAVNIKDSVPGDAAQVAATAEEFKKDLESELGKGWISVRADTDLSVIKDSYVAGVSKSRARVTTFAGKLESFSNPIGNPSSLKIVLPLSENGPVISSPMIIAPIVNAPLSTQRGENYYGSTVDTAVREFQISYPDIAALYVQRIQYVHSDMPVFRNIPIRKWFLPITESIESVARDALEIVADSKSSSAESVSSDDPRIRVPTTLVHGVIVRTNHQVHKVEILAGIVLDTTVALPGQKTDGLKILSSDGNQITVFPQEWADGKLFIVTPPTGLN
jgi:hypothetical protein